MKNRIWNKFRAYIGGYFWLPCPICGQRFGGHERGGGILSDSKDSGSGKILCPDCPDSWFVNDEGEPELYNH